MLHLDGQLGDALRLVQELLAQCYVVFLEVKHVVFEEKNGTFVSLGHLLSDLGGSMLEMDLKLLMDFLKFSLDRMTRARYVTSKRKSFFKSKLFTTVNISQVRSVDGTMILA